MRHSTSTVWLVLRTVRMGGFALLATAVAVDCTVRRRGPELPDLEKRTATVERRTVRTEKIRRVMTRDLDRIAELVSTLRSPPEELFADGFPIDLFKHVVVECLNTPATDGSAESNDRTDGETVPPSGSEPSDTPSTQKNPDRGLELSCATRFVDRLAQKLAERPPADRRRAFDLLRSIDRYRELRIRLRRRIAKLDAIVRENRRILADRRADLRKLRSRWKTRKPELPPKRWQKLRNRFQRMETRLRELKQATERLESASDAWPEMVDESNSRLYFAITSRWKRGN